MFGTQTLNGFLSVNKQTLKLEAERHQLVLKFKKQTHLILSESDKASWNQTEPEHTSYTGQTLKGLLV